MPKRVDWTQVIPGKTAAEVKRQLLSINLSNARNGLPHVDIIGEANGSVVIGCTSLESVKAAKVQICQK